MTDLDFEFALADDLCYLNHAAVSPWPRRTADAVRQFAEENVQQGATHYPAWVEKETLLRSQLQQLIHAQSQDEIALLKNTSEALSVVAEGIRWQANDNIVSSNSEFPSNRIPWLAQAKHGVKFREVDLSSATTPEQSLINACDENTKLLTISSVQYGTGLKMDLKQLGEFCRSNNILFCVDAIQSLGAHEIDAVECSIDFMMADGHKWLMAPEGIALFYCRKECQEKLELRQFGWHMLQNAGNYDDKSWSPATDARRFECGSPNMLGIHALSASLSLILEVGQDNISNMIEERVQLLIDELGKRAFQILSPEESSRRAGIVTFLVPGKDMSELHQKLMKKRLICAYRGGGVRLSSHFYTPEAVIYKSLDIIDVNI